MSQVEERYNLILSKLPEMEGQISTSTLFTKYSGGRFNLTCRSCGHTTSVGARQVMRYLEDKVPVCLRCSKYTDTEYIDLITRIKEKFPEVIEQVSISGFNQRKRYTVHCDACQIERQINGRAIINCLHGLSRNLCYSCSSKQSHQAVLDTMVQRYGTTNPLEIPRVREKVISKNLQRCGKPWNVLSDSFKERNALGFSSGETIRKAHSTRKRNGSYTKSDPEDVVYSKLLSSFGEVIRHYRSDLYPFECDYYIPPKDMYIEYHGFWTHGLRPYDSSDADCVSKLKHWEERKTANPFYKNAIYTWTDLDVRKKETAKHNQLNWRAFYSINEVDKFLETV